MRLRPIAVLAAAAVAATVGLTANPAQADEGKYEWTEKCSAGGFTGYIKAKYDKGPNGTENVKAILYLITRHIGSEANISWHDGGTLPAKQFSTGDGEQSGAVWNYLPGAVPYTRGTGYTSVGFVFDKLGPDPKCSTGHQW
jgi:hypothetical protein